MPANVGRNLVLASASTTLAGIRTKSISINNEPIDVTTDDDNGYRTLLSVAGESALDISFSGVTKDAVLRAAIQDNTAMELPTTTITYPNGDEISGTFILTSLEESGEYKDAVQFSGTLQSSGAWTYTPAP